VAAATAVVGYNLFRDSTLRVAQRHRRLIAVGLKGSAAALDTRVDVMVGSEKVGELFNDGTGAPNRDDMFRLSAPIPAGSELAFQVADAPATNPINAVADVEG
tara:strand:+ start:906 stop:1214 length:309 start_codon:yes stop_codon:yes gene_type:complete